MVAVVGVLYHLWNSSRRNYEPPSILSEEDKHLKEGAPRVRFSTVWKGTITDLLAANPHLKEEYGRVTAQMSSALFEMERSGAAPVLFDGKVAGNSAAAIGPERWLVVSKSGRLGGRPADPLNDVCVVTDFDEDAWEVTYYSQSRDILPTSDANLHWVVFSAHKTLEWKSVAMATLHGHALEKKEVAEKLGLPCSEEVTPNSTPVDNKVMLKLLKDNPYPEHDVYIRRDHGFFIIGSSIEAALKTFVKRVKPHTK